MWPDKQGQAGAAGPAHSVPPVDELHEQPAPGTLSLCKALPPLLAVGCLHLERCRNGVGMGGGGGGHHKGKGMQECRGCLIPLPRTSPEPTQQDHVGWCLEGA